MIYVAKALRLLILGLYTLGQALSYLMSNVVKRPVPNPLHSLIGLLGDMGECIVETGFKIKLIRIKLKGPLDQSMHLEFLKLMKTQEGIEIAKDASNSIQKHYPHKTQNFITYLQTLDQFDFQCTFTFSYYQDTGRLHPYIAHLRQQYFREDRSRHFAPYPLYRYFFEGMTSSSMRHRFETYQWNKFLERADA